MNRMIKDPKTGRFIRHAIPNICTVEGCNNRVRGRGFCNSHYLRFIRYGNPLIKKKNSPGQGGLNEGYRYITVNNRKMPEQRHIMEQYLGRKLERWEIVHHIDGNKLNNVISNLRVISRSKHLNHHPEVLSNLSLGPKSSRRTRN